MRTAVDVMGGDHAPGEILKGCFDAATLLAPDDILYLVGDEAVIQPALQAANLPPEKRGCYRVVHASEVIAMDESPAVAVRGKPNSSISVMCKLAAKGEADVVISAGNTGACVAAALLRMRTLPGVDRPGIAVIFPSHHGDVVVCDVGANIAPKPIHFQQYAIMASAFSSALCGVAQPRVGLLSIGEEDAKGTGLVKESNRLLRSEPLIRFGGNVEGRDLFAGTVDVIVCDGFAGNIVLKCVEGMAEGLMKMILAEARELDPSSLRVIEPVMKKIYARHDWQEYGGAPLLGLNGICLICHGKSEARAIRSAIRAGKQLCAAGLNEKIVAALEKSVKVRDEGEAGTTADLSAR